ncbi:MAG: hypothetical protein QME60_02895 [Verrucomicrobiota bacterium]|nr:hypothetical protein [Verrucomicrobiota bacterium]
MCPSAEQIMSLASRIAPGSPSAVTPCTNTMSRVLMNRSRYHPLRARSASTPCSSDSASCCRLFWRAEAARIWLC